MSISVRITPFQRKGRNLVQGEELTVTNQNLSRTPVNFHDFTRAQTIFASQEVFRNRILELPENIGFVSGEVNGQVFVLEAAQAQALIENAVDAEKLIEGLNP